MTTLPWLADVLRDAGLTVIEHAGWKTRGRPGTWAPRFGIVHATAAPASQSDATQIRIVRDGREGLVGPIANACVARNGVWHVLAAGRCNTTIPGTSGPYGGLGNTYALGIEACNDNRDEPWPDVQYTAYVIGWAAIARKLGWGPDRLRGHREHTPGRKTDPTFNMAAFRTHVAGRLANKGGNDVGTLEGRQAQQLKDTHYTLTSGINNPVGTGSVPFHVWAEWMTGAIKAQTATITALANAQGDAEAVEQLHTELTNLAENVTRHAVAEDERDAALAASLTEKLNGMRDLLEALDSGTLTQDELVSRIRITVDVPDSGTGDDGQ